MKLGFGKPIISNNRHAVQRAEAWVREKLARLDYDEDSMLVLVTEIVCTDPNCAPIETLVALLDKRQEKPLTTTDRQITDDSYSNNDSNSSGNSSSNNGINGSGRWADKVYKPVVEVTERDIDELPIPRQSDFWVVNSERQTDTDAIKDGTANTNSSFVSDSIGVTNGNNIDVRNDSKVHVTMVKMKPRETLMPVRRSDQQQVMEKQIVNASDVNTNSTSSVSDATHQSVSYITDGMVKKVPTLSPISYNSTANKTGPSPAAVGTKLDYSGAVTTNYRIGSTHSSSSSRETCTNSTYGVSSGVDSSSTSLTVTGHEESGRSRRSCPCCNPDGIDTIIDSMLSSI